MGGFTTRGQSRKNGSISGQSKRIFLLQSVQNDLGPHRASYSASTVGSFHRGRACGPQSDDSPSTDEVVGHVDLKVMTHHLLMTLRMSEWKYTPSPPYAFMVSTRMTLSLYFKGSLRYVITIFNYLWYFRF